MKNLQTFEEFINENYSVNEDNEELLLEFDISFWDAFVAGAGFELGRNALEIGIAIGIIILGGGALTVKMIISKVKKLISDKKKKAGAKEAIDFLASNKTIKDLVDSTKALQKLRNKKIDKRKKDAEDQANLVKVEIKDLTKNRQNIAKDLVNDMKEANLSKEAVEYLADEISYIRNSGYFKELMS